MRTTYNGTVEGSYQSLPFGDGLSTAGSDNDACHFAGLDHDPETNTDYAQFRQYGTSQGRWMTPDPYNGSYDLTNPQSMNRYGYVLNSPTTAFDPSGLHSAECYGIKNCNPAQFWGGGELPGSRFGEFDLLEWAFAATGGGQPYLDPYGDGVDYTPLVYGNIGDLSLLSGLADSYSPTNTNTTRQLTACQQTVLDAVNNQFGTNLTADNVLPASDPNPTPGGGQVNVDFGGGYGLSPSQFNAIQPGRYAPPGFFGFITGYGPSLHVVASPSSIDPTAGGFANSNFGGIYSFGFTAHMDSAWADNPLGALFHLIIDVLGHNSRNPCP